LRTQLQYSFDVKQILELVKALQLPPIFKTQHGYSVLSFEAVCLVLAQLCSQGTEWQLVCRFNRSQAATSDIINTTITMIDDQWQHLLQWDGVLLSPENMVWYANAVHKRGSPLKTVWGFIKPDVQT
jgi:hypothetical protein